MDFALVKPRELRIFLIIKSRSEHVSGKLHSCRMNGWKIEAHRTAERSASESTVDRVFPDFDWQS